MRVFRTAFLLALGTSALCACTDAYEQRGLCSYLGTCEMGLETHIDLNYCKELGSCDDGKDPTEYTISGHHEAVQSDTKSESKSDRSTGGTGGDDGS